MERMRGEGAGGSGGRGWGMGAAVGWEAQVGKGPVGYLGIQGMPPAEPVLQREWRRRLGHPAELLSAPGWVAVFSLMGRRVDGTVQLAIAMVMKVRFHLLWTPSRYPWRTLASWPLQRL
jgi:hypothetical protein